MQVALYHIPTDLCIGVYEATYTTANTIEAAGIHFNQDGRPTKQEMRNHETDFGLNERAFGFEIPSWAKRIRKADLRLTLDVSNVPDSFDRQFFEAHKITAVENVDGNHVITAQQLADFAAQFPPNTEISDLDFDNDGDTEAEITVWQRVRENPGSDEWNAKCLLKIRETTLSMVVAANEQQKIVAESKKNEQLLRDIIGKHPDLAKRIFNEEAL